MDKAENTTSGGALETHDFTIAGMGCDNCARKLDRALRAKDGVKEVRVDSIAGRATVTFDPTRTNIPELREVVVKSGYRAGAVEPVSPPREVEAPPAHNSRILTLRNQTSLL